MLRRRLPPEGGSHKREKKAEAHKLPSFLVASAFRRKEGPATTVLSFLTQSRRTVQGRSATSQCVTCVQPLVVLSGTRNTCTASTQGAGNPLHAMHAAHGPAIVNHRRDNQKIHDEP